MINPPLHVILLIAGSLIPAWCSLAWTWRIGALSIGFLVGALPGIVRCLSTSETGNLHSKIGLVSTVVWRIACWLGVDLLLRLVVLAKCWILVLLLRIVGSC